MFEKLTPAVAGLLIMLALFCAAGGLFTNAYLPYREYMEIEQTCTRGAAAAVTDPEVYKEGIYYYGPEVEFLHMNKLVRTTAVNTAMPKTVHSLNDKVTIKYEPEYITNVLIEEDDGIKDDFKRKCILSAVIAAAGLIAFIIGAAKNIAASRPEKITTFDKTPDGRSFEEWASSINSDSDKDNTDND